MIAGRLLMIVCSFLCFSTLVIAQSKAVPDTSKSVRINPQKPTVYLQFVKVGICRHAESFTVLGGNPCESRRTDVAVDKFNAVWLRLVNNTRWAIKIDLRNMYGPPTVDGFDLQDKRTVTAVNDGAEVDPRYDVEAERGCDFHESAPGLPCKPINVQAPVIRWMGVFSPVYLPSGRSLILAVKREYLAKYLSIFVIYNYEWETSATHPSTFEEPRHRVYFSWYALEKAVGKPNPKNISQGRINDK